jgi:hypothetical protein
MSARLVYASSAQMLVLLIAAGLLGCGGKNTTKEAGVKEAAADERAADRDYFQVLRCFCHAQAVNSCQSAWNLDWDSHAGLSMRKGTLEQRTGATEAWRLAIDAAEAEYRSWEGRTLEAKKAFVQKHNRDYGDYAPAFRSRYPERNVIVEEAQDLGRSSSGGRPQGAPMAVSGRAGRPNPFGCGQAAGWLLLAWGALAAVSAARNLALTARCTPQPQEWTLREVLDGRAGPNPHVAITDFRPCDRYLTRNFKRSQLRGVIYIGIVPAGDDPSGVPQLIVAPGSANEEKHLLGEWGHRRALAGILEKPDRLPDGDHQQLRQTYPGLDLPRCLILEEGRKPMTAGEGWAWLGAALSALLLGGVLLHPARAVRRWGRWRGVKTD